MGGLKLQIQVATRRAQWREPALSLFLAIQVFFVFVAVPISATGLFPTTVLAFLFGMVLFCACLVVAADIPAVVATVGAAVLSVIATFIHANFPDQRTAAVGAGAAVANLLVVTWVIVRAVFGPGSVNAHRIRGAIALYLNLGLVFAAVFRLAVLFDTKAFSGLPIDSERRLLSTLVYFSYASLTTTGFGDVIPVHPMMRSLAVFEALLGQLYPATLLARMVTLELEGRKRRRDD